MSCFFRNSVRDRERRETSHLLHHFEEVSALTPNSPHLHTHPMSPGSRRSSKSGSSAASTSSGTSSTHAHGATAQHPHTMHHPHAQYPSQPGIPPTQARAQTHLLGAALPQAVAHMPGMILPVPTASAPAPAAAAPRAPAPVPTASAPAPTAPANVKAGKPQSKGAQ